MQEYSSAEIKVPFYANFVLISDAKLSSFSLWLRVTRMYYGRHYARGETVGQYTNAGTVIA